MVFCKTILNRKDTKMDTERRGKIANIFEWEEFRLLEMEVKDDFKDIKAEIDAFEKFVVDFETNSENEALLVDMYKSYFKIFTYYRINKDFTRMNTFCSKYHSLFLNANQKKEIPTLQHIKLLNDKEYIVFKTYRNIEDKRSFNEAYEDLLDESGNFVKKVEEISEKMDPRSDAVSFAAGVFHLYADIYVTILEVLDEEISVKLKTTLENKNTFVKKVLDKAIKLLPEYAKFYETKARLFLSEDDFIKAEKYVHMAIDKEDSTKSTYAQAIINYNFTKYRIISRQSEKAAHDLQQVSEERLNKMIENITKANEVQKEELKQIEESIEDSHLKTIEVVGFFTGIISFVISSVEIATALDVAEAAKLITMLIGGWIVSYAAFSFTFKKPTTESKKQSLIVAVLGFLIMLGGKYYGI